MPKTANTKITTLQIREDQHLGSLTCHILRDTSNTLFDHFNATTKGLAFSNAGTYDPYSFGKKRNKFYNCDIYLRNSNFSDLVVDLEVVLILQPLLRRQSINVCDVPLITRQTVHIGMHFFRLKSILYKNILVKPSSNPKNCKNYTTPFFESYLCFGKYVLNI